MALERKPILLGIDHGQVRIGLAVSDPLGLTAQPVGVFPAADPATLFARMEELVRERDIHKAVLGLPLNMDGSEGPAAQAARAFASLITERLALEVVFWDERLTTVRAERAMLSGDLSRKKRSQRRDTIAAQLILQAWLDAQPR